MTPQTQLWNLRGQLFELMEEREAIAQDIRDLAGSEDQAARQAEFEALEKAIGTFVLEKVKQVDEIRAPLLAMRDAAKVCREEEKRAGNQALAWDRKADTLEDLVKVCLQHLSESGYWKPKETRKVFSPLGSFTLRGNGGKQPVVVTDESLVPDELCNVTMTFPSNYLKHMQAFFAGAEDVVVKFGPRVPSLSRIGEALNQPCLRCDGNGVVEAWGDVDEDAEFQPAENPCRDCNGTGKQTVAGCRLDPRGESLQVK